MSGQFLRRPAGIVSTVRLCPRSWQVATAKYTVRCSSDMVNLSGLVSVCLSCPSPSPGRRVVNSVAFYRPTECAVPNQAIRGRVADPP